MEKRMTDLRDSLAQVVGLSRQVSEAANDGGGPTYERLMNELAINSWHFLQTHGPALLAMMEEMDGR